jgi:hypothetical protein
MLEFETVLPLLILEMAIVAHTTVKIAIIGTKLCQAYT